MDRSEFKKFTNYVFGGAAATITNISLIVGLGSAGAGKPAILGGLLTIALADNISDSLGIHLYKEAEGSGSRISFLATALNFFARLLVSLTFVGIILTCSIPNAILLATVWGLLLLIVISYFIGRSTGQTSILEIVKHVLVAAAVIIMSRYVGYLVGRYFS
jgi:vacuolar iron transporter family protein